MSTKNKVIFDTTKFCNLYLILIDDLCYNYQNLSDAKRKSSYVTSKDGPWLCDNLLLEGWYRFVGAAGTKMPTTRVSAYRCGTGRSGWLDDAHPTVEDVEVQRNVCFSDRVEGCKFRTSIFVKKKCGSYFIYKFFPSPRCNSRYCGTDWMWSNWTILERRGPISWSWGTRTPGFLRSPLFIIIIQLISTKDFIRWRCLVYLCNQKCLEVYIL